MKRLLFAALLLVAVPLPLAGQDSSVVVPAFRPADVVNAQPIEITGPEKAKSGEEITLRLNGTPTLDLAKPLIDQLAWLMGADERLRVFWIAPGVPPIPVDVRGELVFASSGATMQPILRVLCGAAGEYTLVVDWNAGQKHVVFHRVLVGGAVPPVPPPIPPVPPVPPVPPGPRFVLIVSETQDRTPDEAVVLAQLREFLRSQASEWRIMDPSTDAAWLQPQLKKLEEKGVKGSALMVYVPSNPSSEGGYLLVEPLPMDGSKAIEDVKEALK